MLKQKSDEQEDEELIMFAVDDETSDETSFESDMRHAIFSHIDIM